MFKKFFDVETHFESKIGKNNLCSQGRVINFQPAPFCSTRKPIEKGIKRIIKEKFKYEEFKIINELHNDYIRELKGNQHPNAFNDILYKSELTGAKIRINGKFGFVIEERKNSLTVIFEGDKIKIFPKAVWNFVYSFDGVDYMFFTSNMKKNRFLK